MAPHIPHHHKPLRQIIAEKERGRPANPSQLGDPIDLKAETSDEPDPIESPWNPASMGKQDVMGGRKEERMGSSFGIMKKLRAKL
ncbi:hypothetical protein C8A05DRAFT_20607 [Staphylotrichum tortipilum]|uniref:Uncharacterized protein n=1 Tax=Staphylotrichum tortipilum TaxID=2831512 RepID=A0AAN6MA62_9PEZI|nr:hypothetical protein C8A05DRAFT_20607 [Staphylotrichum longicolle]